MAKMSKNEQMAKDCIEGAKKTLGAGWSHVSKDVQWGLISARILALFMAQDEEITGDRVRAYITGVTEAAQKMHEGE